MRTKLVREVKNEAEGEHGLFIAQVAETLSSSLAAKQLIRFDLF